MTDTKRIQENRSLVPESRHEEELLTPTIRLTNIDHGPHWRIGHFYFPADLYTRESASREFRRLMLIERQRFFVEFRNNRNDQVEAQESKGIENTYRS